MSDQPASLRFVRRFRNGVLGTLVIEHLDHGYGIHGPGPLKYTWNGPRPPHGGERLKWAIECQRIFSDRFDVSFNYITADERGPVRFWFTPGKRPKKISLKLEPGWHGFQTAEHFNEQGELYPSWEGGAQ